MKTMVRATIASLRARSPFICLVGAVGDVVTDLAELDAGFAISAEKTIVLHSALFGVDGTT